MRGPPTGPSVAHGRHATPRTPGDDRFDARGLYLSTRDRCAAVSGLDADAARALVDRLLSHSTSHGNVLAHRWAPGDVVLWDNARVMHRADHADVVGDRTFHRGMVSADGHHT